MFPAQIPVLHPDELSRCEQRRQVRDHGKSLSLIQKSDAAQKESIYHALWKDDLLRTIEYEDIEVHVKNGVVHLNGHIVGTSSRSRIEKAMRSVPGIRGIQSHLVLDDKLTLEVASSLAGLEHTYDCKFFTGASHGVISIDGVVRDDVVKLLAEKQVSGNPTVRGVINHVRVEGSGPESQGLSFLQPAIGESIHFLDGISGIVRQVIINPSNRRVIAMILQGVFTDQRSGPNSSADGKARPPEQIVIVPMGLVRYLTRDSGFLSIKSGERNRYQDFDSASYSSPRWGWAPPHPYCTDDVLFPIEQQDTENHFLQQVSESLNPETSKEQLLWEQLLANDSLGG